MLLGADADLVDRLDAYVLELSAVGGGEVEQRPTFASLFQESPVELGRDLLADLVAAAADAGPDAGPDEAAAVLVLHETDGSCGDAVASATPARVHQAGNSLLRVPQDYRVAVGIRGEERHVLTVRDQRVDVADRAAGLVNPSHPCAVHRPDGGQLGSVEAQNGGKGLPRREHGSRVGSVLQAHRADR